MSDPPAGATTGRLAWLRNVPPYFAWALALAAGFMVFTAWDQSHWWRIKEDYNFGWLVPVFVIYVAFDRWPRILAALAACAAAEPAARWVRWTLNTAAVLCLLWGVLWFLLGSFYRAGAGTSQPGTAAITMGMAAIVFALLFFNAPSSTEAIPDGPPSAGAEAPRAAGLCQLWQEPRVRLVGLFLFPVLVWGISAPLVSALESQLSLFLLRKVVTVVFFVFEMLGLPIEQQGNVLALPKGSVGVADACSGIRSLTACLFAGSFLGAVFLDRLWKKVALVVAALGFAFLTNLLRSLFLTSWAYRYGPAAISGTVHDAAGYAVLGLTCAGLLSLVPLLNLKIESAPAKPVEEGKASNGL
jgi:exosortase/archaeosortase family protein